jgi:hypothetical protein
LQPDGVLIFVAADNQCAGANPTRLNKHFLNGRLWDEAQHLSHNRIGEGGRLDQPLSHRNLLDHSLLISRSACLTLPMNHTKLEVTGSPTSHSGAFLLLYS